MKDDIFTYSTDVSKITDGATVITESKIEHIESLLNRAYQEESGMIRYIPGVFTSFVVFLCGFSVTNLLSILFGFITINEKTIVAKFSIPILSVISILSISFIIYNFTITCYKRREYKSFIQEVQNIVLKLKNSINSSTKPPV